MGLLLPAVQSTRKAARRITAPDSCSQIALSYTVITRRCTRTVSVSRFGGKDSSGPQHR